MQRINMTDLYNHKFIVFGSDHYQTLGAVRSLGEKGLKVDVILHPRYSNHPFMCPNSRYTRDVSIVNSVEEGYEILVNKYGKEEFKPFVYSCDDWVESCLDLHYDELIDHFYFFNGRSAGVVTKYMDKATISNLAEECGCRVPKSEIVKKGEMPRTLRYPIITKSISSTTGAWKGDSRICYSPDELQENYKTIESTTLLIEEFVEKKNELCIDGFSFNNGCNVFIPYQTTYLRLSPTGYSNYMTVEPLHYPQVIEYISSIMKKVGFNGIFSVEFLIGQDDKLYFLEVNFRNSTWSYAYTVGGANLPYGWAQAMLLGRVDMNTIKLRQKPFTAIAEFIDYAQFVRTKKVSIFEWLKNVITADCRYYLVLSDPKPIFAGIRMKVMRIIKKVAYGEKMV